MKYSVKIVLVNPESKLLLQLRDNIPGIVDPGRWDFIGGAMEKGETAQQSIRRELKEEISSEVEDIAQIPELYVNGREEKYDDDHIVFMFRGSIRDAIRQIRLYEGQEVRYFGITDLRSINFPRFYTEYVNKYKGMIFKK